jgi:hypothetical protein
MTWHQTGPVGIVAINLIPFGGMLTLPDKVKHRSKLPDANSRQLIVQLHV